MVKVAKDGLKEPLEAFVVILEAILAASQQDVLTKHKVVGGVVLNLDLGLHVSRQRAVGQVGEAAALHVLDTVLDLVLVVSGHLEVAQELVVTLSLQLHGLLGVVEVPLELGVDLVVSGAIEGHLGLVVPEVVSGPGQLGVNLLTSGQLNGLLDLAAILVEAGSHQLLAVELNLPHVAIHVLNHEGLEPFPVGGDLQELAGVPLALNLKVLVESLVVVEHMGQLIQEVLAEESIVSVLGGDVDLLLAAAILLEVGQVKLKLVQLALHHGQVGLNLEGGQALQAVHVVEESVEWASVLHEPVNLAVEANIVTVIQGAHLGLDLKVLLVVVCASGVEVQGSVTSNLKDKVKGGTGLGQVLELELLESLIGNSHLALTNIHTRVSNLILELSGSLGEHTLQLGGEQILVIQEDLDTGIRHVLLGIELKNKLASGSEVKVKLEGGAVAIKVNISKAVVLLAIKINNKVHPLLSIVVLSLEGVSLLASEDTLEALLVNVVNLKVVLLGLVLVVVEEESALGSGSVVALHVDLDSGWPVGVVLAVGHEVNLGVVEGTLLLPLKLDLASVHATEEEAQLVVDVKVKQHVAKLGLAVKLDVELDRLDGDRSHELSEVLEVDLGNTTLGIKNIF